VSAATATVRLDAHVDRLATPLDDPATDVVWQRYASALQTLLAFTEPMQAHRAGNGPGSDYVGDHRAYAFAPFITPCASRFSDGSFGVLYAGFDLDTAQWEALYHVARFYLDASLPAGAIATRVHLRFRVCGDISDLRLVAGGSPSLYDPDPANYRIPQSWGLDLYERGAEGVWYDSVRHPGGECIGVFVPRIVSDMVLLKRYEYTWDGATFTTRKEITPIYHTL
jgi:hypothetical protein